MNKTTIKAFLAVTFISFVFAQTVAADVVEESFTVSPGGTLIVDTDAGSIEVETHNKNTVEVKVERRGESEDNFKLSISQSGNDVIVDGDKESSSWFSYGSSKVHFEITVPKEYDVDLDTNGGSLSIESLVGEVDARTSGGSIKLGEIKGNVDVKTSGGSIRVEDVAGEIDAHTSGGSIKVSFSEQPSGDSKLTTSGGSVTAYLHDSVAVDLSAKTSGGSVSSEIDVNGTLKRNKIEGTINGGGPDLILRTSGGSVRVKDL